MAEYINKDVLIEHIKNSYWADFDTEEVIALINQVPTWICESLEESEKKIKMEKIKVMLGELVKENGGYCPCMLSKTPDTKCPCREFKEAEKGTVCHCGRYKKET